MAQSVNLKPFYAALGVIAIAGAVWIFSERSGGTITLPTTTTAEAFPGYVLGSDTAKVEVIEYVDFQCPVCATFTILTVPDIKAKLVNTGRIRWVFRDYPVPEIHDKAVLAHLVAACANDQGRFWEMHDQLFYNQGAWSNSNRPRGLFDDYARAIGLEMGSYDSCVDERRHLDRITATKNAGARMGISGTPNLIIGNQLVPGSIGFPELLRLVEEAERAASQ
jgi:protein-disulfide isomerase